MSERVSDERLERACEHGGHGVHALAPSEKCDLALDLHDARAKLAAWEPVVKVAQEVASVTDDLRDFAMAGVEPDSQQSRDASHALGRATGALTRAVDALPPEMRP